MTATLYSWQEEAVDEMFSSSSFLLADEMGLGKTVTALWEIGQRTETEDDPKVLIVCPKSVIPVWYDHIAWILPKYISNFTVVNYERVRTELPEFMKTYYTYIILDEAHFIKNRKALRTKAVKKLRGKYKRALTGSPIVNRPDELWSLLNWMFPQAYRSYWKFFEAYCEYWQHPTMGYKKVTGVRDVEGLRAELKGIMLRRKKQDVLKELPDKYYTRIPVFLGTQQRRVYEEMRKESLAWVGQHEDEPVPAAVAVAKLTRLRMFASAYAEWNEETGKTQLIEPSAKLDALMTILNGTDSSVVVFSQFKQLIRLAERRLQDAKLGYATITGDTSDSDRGDMVARFQAGDVPVFLGTTRAGGVGITLHRASTVVFLDRSWSPADNLQAEDRLHRIGQKNAVQVILLQAVDSVDSVVEAALELKWSWIRSILE